MVWQTTDNGDGFCLQTGLLCTFAQFKAQYPDGRFTAVQVAIGTGVPAVTSYADGVTVTMMEDGTEVTDTWDFDVAAAPTPTPAATAPDPRPLPRPRRLRAFQIRAPTRRALCPIGAAGIALGSARPAVGSGGRDRSEAPPPPLRAASRSNPYGLASHRVMTTLPRV